MAANKLTDVSIIEQHKENIQPLPGGRSVSKLATNFKSASKSVLQFKEQQKKERSQFEARLLDIEESDDPLQEYINYIDWVYDNYPQGANSESGLLNLLERCTSCFRDVEHYKNDPRYLKIWLEYTNFSDSPRDIYFYLAKKGIGNQLALYYEEFAKHLELAGRDDDAGEIYELGIENQARPLIRLQKNYVQFKQRQNEIKNKSESATPAGRSVLSVKRGDDIIPSQVDNQDNSIRKKPKLSVFRDVNKDENQSVLHTIFHGTSDNNEIGSIKSRVKENIQQSKPWAGEILTQEMGSIPKVPKIEVFRDSPTNASDNKHPMQSFTESEDGHIYTIIKQPGKNTEQVFVNMDLIYPSQDEEYSFAEIIAMSKEFSSLEIREDDAYSNSNSKSSDKRLSCFSSDHENIKEETHIDARYSDFMEGNHTLTIPLRNESDVTSSFKKTPNSPTMTMFSRIANNEVIGMFNEAAHNLNTDDEEDKTDNTTNYDGFITETIQMPLDSNQQVNDLEPVATPPTDKEESDDKSFHSSPFIERPSLGNLDANLNLINPLDANIRENLLSNLKIPLSVYPGYNDFSHIDIRKMSKFNDITDKKSKAIMKGAPNSIINYCGDISFCLRSELGKGGFGVVYLIETETGKYEALKIESPSSKWEFYILNQINRRLIGHDVANSMIRPSSLYFFKDESYLFIKYFPQGTILDVVNFFRGKGSGVDEVLCIFLTIELIKAVEALHTIGILHGDLKADNCMIRFEKVDSGKWSEYYKRDGSDGWNKKGMTLIDFGRAIDLTMFDENTQFVSNWPTDQQDCVQMNRNQPWSFEADYYGLAAIIHTMLFGTYIKINENIDGTISLESPLKRYWQRDLWSDLFNLLLNPYPQSVKPTFKKPLLEELKSRRLMLENWLEDHSSTLKLKSTISDIEYSLNEKNKRVIQG